MKDHKGMCSQDIVIPTEKRCEGLREEQLYRMLFKLTKFSSVLKGFGLHARKSEIRYI